MRSLTKRNKPLTHQTSSVNDASAAKLARFERMRTILVEENPRYKSSLTITSGSAGREVKNVAPRRFSRLESQVSLRVARRMSIYNNNPFAMSQAQQLIDQTLH
jgi:hypothetical protein